MTDITALINGLRDYEAELRRHNASVRESFKELERALRRLREKYEGTGARDFRAHFNRTRAGLDQYLQGTEAIAQLLQKRLERLVAADRRFGADAAPSRASARRFASDRLSIDHEDPADPCEDAKAHLERVLAMRRGNWRRLSAAKERNRDRLEFAETRARHAEQRLTRVIERDRNTLDELQQWLDGVQTDIDAHGYWLLQNFLLPLVGVGIAWVSLQDYASKLKQLAEAERKAEEEDRILIRMSDAYTDLQKKVGAAHRLVKERCG